MEVIHELLINNEVSTTNIDCAQNNVLNMWLVGFELTNQILTNHFEHKHFVHTFVFLELLKGKISIAISKYGSKKMFKIFVKATEILTNTLATELTHRVQLSFPETFLTFKITGFCSSLQKQYHFKT